MKNSFNNYTKIPTRGDNLMCGYFALGITILALSDDIPKELNVKELLDLQFEENN